MEPPTIPGRCNFLAILFYDDELSIDEEDPSRSLYVDAYRVVAQDERPAGLTRLELNLSQIVPLDDVLARAPLSDLLRGSAYTDIPHLGGDSLRDDFDFLISHATGTASVSGRVTEMTLFVIHEPAPGGLVVSGLLLLVARRRSAASIARSISS